MSGDLRPRLEGVLELSDGRQIGFAEYGAPDGRPVLWFHGTPGGRRQIPPAARAAATRLGVRLLALERPGIGRSTRHLYPSILGWARDVEEIADRLGFARYACVGLSGGGPYVLGCAAHAPDRVVAAGVLGGVAPACGDDAAPGGLVGLASRFAPLLRLAHEPIGRVLWGGVQLIVPVRHQAMELYARFSPPGDRLVFARDGMKAMFVDDLAQAVRRQAYAPVLDVVLFTRPWGFALSDVRVPIHFWHGDADPIVPLAHAEHMAARVPGARLVVRPGESHLGSLDAAPEVLATMLEHWPDGTPAVR